MTGNAWALIIAFFSGSLVTGVAAVLNVFVNRSTMKSTLEQQRELAYAQHEADRRLASDARFFDQRSKAYLDAIDLLSGMYYATLNLPETYEEGERLLERYEYLPPRELHARLLVFAPKAADLFTLAYGLLREGLDYGNLATLARREARQQQGTWDTHRDYQRDFENTAGTAWQRYEEFLDAIRRDFG